MVLSKECRANCALKNRLPNTGLFRQVDRIRRSTKVKMLVFTKLLGPNLYAVKNRSHAVPMKMPSC